VSLKGVGNITFCGTYPRIGLVPFVEWKLMFPAEMGKSPNMLLTRVVLPEPFSPTRNVSAFRGMEQEASDNIFLFPIITVTLSYSTMFLFKIYPLYVEYHITFLPTEII